MRYLFVVVVVVVGIHVRVCVLSFFIDGFYNNI